MRTLLTGIATFIALASATPAFASDVAADRPTPQRAAQTTPAAKGTATSADSGRVAEPQNVACACSCMKGA